MTLGEMRASLHGKAIELHNEFNGRRSRFDIKQVSHAKGGFLVEAESEEGIYINLVANVPTILNMEGKGITNELPCIKGGTFKATVRII